VDQSLERSEEPDNAEHSDDADEAGETENSENTQVAAAACPPRCIHAKERHDKLWHDRDHDDEVKPVKSDVTGGAEKLFAAQTKEPQTELQNEECVVNRGHDVQSLRHVHCAIQRLPLDRGPDKDRVGKDQEAEEQLERCRVHKLAQERAAVASCRRH